MNPQLQQRRFMCPQLSLPLTPAPPHTPHRVSGLKELQEKEEQYFEPLLLNMSVSQCVVVALMETLPAVLLLLPVAQGGLGRYFLTYCTAVAQTFEPGEYLFRSFS